MNTVFVNARFLTQQVTGVQRFATEILKAFLTIKPDTVLLAPKNVMHEDLASSWKVEKIGTRTGHLWEQLDLPSYLKRKGSPLLLNLCNTAPLRYSNQIVTIHDLSFLVNPSWFSRRFVIAYRYLMPRIASSARAIITVSQASKSEIAALLKVDASKIHVIHNAVSSGLLKLHTRQAATPNPGQPYLLAVGSIDPRKNLKGLILAYKQLQTPSLRLVIVGSENKVFSASGLQEVLRDVNSVSFTGYVSDSDLVKLYTDAALLVYPSFYEGFGIPPLEAMAAGCPVVASDIASIREVCGEAAYYVNPHDISSIASAIRAVMSSSSLREELIYKGKAKAALYNWSASAQALNRVIAMHQTGLFSLNNQ